MEKLRKALDEKEQEMKARTDALEEQYTHEKRMLLMKAENERQSAVLTVKSEYAARIESCRKSTWKSWPPPTMPGSRRSQTLRLRQQRQRQQKERRRIRNEYGEEEK